MVFPLYPFISLTYNELLNYIIYYVVHLYLIP